eukprot:194930-Alexandrium_andersonii.AAC.1
MLGFRVGDPLSWQPPERCALDAGACRAARMHYIGQGDRRLRLAPSCWGNPSAPRGKKLFDCIPVSSCLEASH